MTAIEQFLKGYPDDIADLSRQVRTFVLKTIPEAEERLQVGWGSVTYSHKKSFCSIIPHSNWVNLQFQLGATLPDPARRLRGTGKNMRHVRISRTAALDDSLADLLRHASRLAP